MVGSLTLSQIRAETCKHCNWYLVELQHLPLQVLRLRLWGHWLEC